MRNPRQAGFTLIEVMLTLLIMGWMLVAITQVLTVVRQDRDRIHNIQEKQLAGPAILDRIESDLRGIVTFNLDRALHLRVQNRSLAGFDADSLDFVTTTDGLMPYRLASNEPWRRADINEVGFRLRPRPDGDDFLELYRREGFGIDDEPFEGGRFALLHDRVKGFEIEVYDEDGPDAEPIESWGTDDDPDHVGLPARIEITLTIELAPRLVREQLVNERRTLDYKRIVRFPQILRRLSAEDQAELEPVLLVPEIQPPSSEATAAGAGGGGGIREGGGGGEGAAEAFGGRDGGGGGGQGVFTSGGGG